MAFKMKGNPMQRNYGIGGFVRGQKLKGKKRLKTESEGIEMAQGIDGLYDRIEWIKETANSEGRPLSNDEKKDIAALQKQIDKL